MSIQHQDLFKAYLSGYHNLYNFYPEINRLNVFPVPDGDTGTNLRLTIASGLKFLNEYHDQKDEKQKLLQFAKGLMMGGRGNSGVLFSQIFRGFTNSLKETNILNVTSFKKAFVNAQATAYQAMTKPVEGTILTIVREINEQIIDFNEQQPVKALFIKLTQIAQKSLKNTPNLLPVLKEAGVVDAGAFGLVKFLEGMKVYFVDNEIVPKSKQTNTTTGKIQINFEDDYGYCTELFVQLEKKYSQQNLDKHVRNHLLDLKCTSNIVVQDFDFIKIHTHTLQPGAILTYMQQYGQFYNVKIDNMTLQSKQHSQTITYTRTLKNKFALVGVVPSNELADYFRSELNFDHVINATKLMNPSVEEFSKAIISVDAKEVYLFPNNSNAFLAARQAAKQEGQSNVFVIRSHNIAEAMVGVIHFDPLLEAKRNLNNVKKMIKSVRTINIYQAANDWTEKNSNLKIMKNDYIAEYNKKIIFSYKSLHFLWKKIFRTFCDKRSEFVTIFYNNEVDPHLLKLMSKYLDENFDVEFELVPSGELVNKLIIAVE